MPAKVAKKRASAGAAGVSGTGRRRNPRGQGERLRDDIIEAASLLMADPASPPLTLRAVAREVGVAATSVYLHFDDISSLVLAVSTRRFDELVQLQDAAAATGKSARERVRAGCVAYCEFGLEHPGHYRVMFESPVPNYRSLPVDEIPGYPTFQRLVGTVAESIGRPADDPESFRTAMLIWQQLHGTVSLRISRPRFPWPPLAESVADVVDRVLDGAGAPHRK